MTSAPPLPPTERSSKLGDSLLRSMLLGMGTGLLVGGGYLLYLAWHTFSSELDCSQLSPNECAFESEALLFLARRQSVFGVALMLIGLASFLFLRAKRRADTPDSPAGSAPP